MRNNPRAPSFQRLHFQMLAVMTVALFFSTPCAAQQFVHPYHVAVDPAGNVYVSELGRHHIQKFDANGVRITQWGSIGTANGEFRSPSGIAVDTSGNVYVADSFNARIQKFTSAGSFLKTWGTPGTLGNEFSRPSAVVVDAGKVYVTDEDLKRVQVFDEAGTPLFMWGGQIGTGDGEFSPFQGPAGIAVEGSHVYVSDTGNHRVHKFSVSGTTVVFVGWAGKCTAGSNCNIARGRSRGFQCTAATCSGLASGKENGQFSLPQALAMNANGNLYVADWLNDRIQRFDASGFRSKWGARGTGGGAFRQPLGIATGADRVYVADTGNNRIQIFDQTGGAYEIWGADVRLTATPNPSPQWFGLNPPILQFCPSAVLLDCGTLPAYRQSTITVESVNDFTGEVVLQVSCCVAAEVGSGSSPGGLMAWFPAGPQAHSQTYRVTVPANGSATAILQFNPDKEHGRFLARVTATNPAVGINRELGVIVTVIPPVGADLRLSVIPDQFADLFPPQSKTSRIEIDSVGRHPGLEFSGPVLLSASCCFDVINQRTVTPSGVSVALSPARLNVQRSGSATATLTITTAGAPSFGKFLVPIVGQVDNSHFRQQTNVGFTVLPTAEPSPPCRPSVEALPLKSIVSLLIDAAESSPRKTQLVVVIGVGGAGPRATDAWRWTIEEDSTLQPTEAMIVLKNTTKDAKEITTVGCSSTGKTIRVEGEQGHTMRIDITDRTLVFRKNTKSTGWTDIAAFSEPAFWTVFGGKKMTFTFED